MKPLIVLVSPMHDSNVGSVARAMLNFGFTDLALVNPRCGLGLEARKWGKHAEHVLDNANRARSLEEAVRGCSLVVGTTGVPARFRRAIKTCLTPEELAAKLRPGERYALVFGPEDRGLDAGEIQRCDILCSIPVKEGVMNLSHSAAVLLYELHKASLEGEGLHYVPADRSRVSQAAHVFDEIVQALPRVRDRLKVSRAFSHVLHRARPTANEVQAMLVALGEVWKILGKPGLKRIKSKPRRARASRA